MKKVYLLLLLCCAAFSGFAQTAASYTFTRTSGTYQTIVGGPGTVAITSGGVINDDSYSPSLPIGFTFGFCGTNYTTFSACSNGWISLANYAGANYPGYATNIGSAGWIFPFWRDDYGSLSVFYYQTSGTSPNRILTVEYNNWNLCCSGGANINVQVKLYEGSNIVQFCYGTNATGNTDFAIGIANSQTDFQNLPSAASTTCVNSLPCCSGSTGLPANGSILSWSACNTSITGGTSAICVGATTTLSTTIGGGTWTSASPAIATVGGGTGIVTGVSGGTAVISYAAPCGTTFTKTVTVNALVATPTGGLTPIDPCATTTLTDASGVGTWASGNIAVATVGAGTGVVTGVAGGTANITFTLTSTGCTAFKTVTVNSFPAITGTTNVCTGATTTLANTLLGGTWTSSNVLQATVVPGTGVVTGVAAGTPNITYTVTGGCFTTTPLTVNATPSAITGTATVCVTQTTTLSDATPGGTWSSSNIAQATIGTSGIVTGVAAGTPVITYTSSAGCTATTSVTVNALSLITGTLNMCLGFGTTLSDATPGGTWSSSTPTVATISGIGVVSSVSLGSSTISYTMPVTGCRATAVVNVTNPPNVYVVTGGGNYCAGGIGLHIGVNTTDVGVSYTLFNGATIVAGPLTGTGASLDFGLFTVAGTYTAVANYGTPCAATMTGSATITVNPLPTAFTVSGGGSYCSGGTGLHVLLSSSTIGINYQLFYGATPIGGAIAGTSGSLDFGFVTSASPPNYTVLATNPTTFCANTMTGSASVSINPLPTSFAITGGGGYCLGGTGVAVGLAGSTVGVNYQLFNSGAPVGAAVAGTGSAISFGLQTGAGLYSVVATNTATGCVNSMSGPVTVTINTLPTVFTITGGGAYCLGGTGVGIGLNGSTIGVNYQLYRGASPVAGALLAGTGVSLAFPLQTVAGSYTVVATNATTGCANNMFGSAVVTINPLPSVFTVTGGGGYCAGGIGVHVGLASSTIGTNYQLLNGLTVVGAAGGTGFPLDFGLFTAAGTYTVVATTVSTGCVGNMAGSVTITVNPLPNIFTVTGGGIYCAGGTGVAVGLSGSNSGINYQLYNGVTPVGSPVAGTGSAITFGLQTLAGSYSVIAVNATTTCTSNMTGSANITVNPLPTIYSVTGGGGYCTGGTGVLVGLTASNLGVNYQLYNGALPTGPLVAGTGLAISFGLQTTAGTYTVVATNPSTGCTNNMAGSAIVAVNTLPTAFTVSGSGNYCLGGTGVPVLLSNSVVGVNYQLFNGVTTVGSPMAGTGSGLNFGPQTAPGTYTVVATNATTGCSNNMLGSAVIGINPLPAVFTVTGGGMFCSGGTGLHVGLSGSVSGTTYQLFSGLVPAGAPVPGTGGALDFGSFPSGTYTVVATITATGCTNNMSGSVTVIVGTAPALFTISGGGNYCASGTGVHVGMVGSATGVNYQLYNGALPVGAPVTGTGGALDFGLQTAAGTYTVIGTVISTGCAATMTGSTTITILPAPTVHNVTGGGGLCPGGSGVAVGLDVSNAGISYQLYNGGTAVGAPVLGSGGLPITFGLQTTPGTYTVIGTNTTTGCSGPMTGSVVVSINPLPIIYNVTGGGNYCSGGTGVVVNLSGSSIGVNYQLFAGAAPVGAPVSGTGSAISFGLQTLAGPYTVVGTDATTGCSSNMNGSVTVGINPLPAIHTITGGGNYCAGGTGANIGLDGSNVGVNYQLFNGLTAIGSPVPGTGGVISFGPQTLAGFYTVVATNTSTTCTNTMTGVVTINIDPLPTAYTVMGGGSICTGGAGVNVMLSGSEVGTTYQLFKGVTAVGAPMPGTGAGLDFGPQTAAGVYTVVGTNTTTGCTGAMAGSVTISVSPLPAAYTVSGGGSYCAGGSGLHVLLSGSNTGVTYQLYNGIGMVGGPMAGTGASLDFGLQTAAGTYTVIATNVSSGCTKPMTGSVTIVINPLPTMFTVVSTSSNYCVGGAGVDISLTGSAVGTTYQLFNGATAVGGPIAGTGGVIDFGYILAAGSYTVVATITATGCSANMAPGVTITVNPLPTVYNVTGGGQYCSGGTGVHIGLSGSNAGVNYQLFRGVTPMGSPVSGTGAALDFGPQTVAGTYTVVANNPLTTCTNNMSGSAIVVVNPIPTANTVTGGGNYCSGGTGVVVGLSGSTLGVNYQLFKGITAVGGPVAGTGAALNFGPQTAAGTYTVVATDGITGCTNNMSSAAVVAINPLPAGFTVTGGGNYCPGGSGVHVGITGSAVGTTYQLYNGLSAVGTPIPGSGSGIDFGLQTAAGTYTVKATNTSTGCSATMIGTATVSVSTLPTSFTVVGGGNYCAGGTGVHVGLSNSTVGVNYTLFDGVSMLGTLPGTGGPLDFGFQTLGGTYTVLGTDATTTCSSYMSGSVSVVVNPVVTPYVTISSASGDTVCSGTFTTLTAMAVNGGGAPTFQWTVNGIPSSTGSSYGYIPTNGDVVGLTMTSNASCAIPAMVNTSMTITVDPVQTPSVNIAATPGNIVCQGTTVLYTAAPSYGGSAPTYIWKKNGLNVGTASTYSYVPANNDIITAVMTSNYHCRTAATANSNSINMTVNVSTVPVVTIAVTPTGTIAPGQMVTLVATVVNGGPTPGYQWLINGNPIPGANMSSYSNTNFVDGDSVSCQVLSSGGCTGLLGMGYAKLHVMNVGVKQLASSGSNIQLIPNPNKGTFIVKGTIGTASEEVTMELTNMLGQVIYTNKVTTTNGEINEKIQLSNIPANGMYMLNLRSATDNKVFHMVIEQ
jgi:uncharacterized protein YjdB